DETCLLSDIAQVLSVTIAPRGCKDEPALVDAVGLGGVAVSFRGRCKGASEINMSAWSSIICGFHGCGRSEPRQPVFKGVLHKLGIGQREAVLGGERLTCPSRGEISRRDGAHLCLGGLLRLARCGAIISMPSRRNSSSRGSLS